MTRTMHSLDIKRTTCSKMCGKSHSGLESLPWRNTQTNNFHNILSLSIIPSWCMPHHSNTTSYTMGKGQKLEYSPCFPVSYTLVLYSVYDYFSLGSHLCCQVLYTVLCTPLSSNLCISFCLGSCAHFDHFCVISTNLDYFSSRTH